MSILQRIRTHILFEFEINWIKLDFYWYRVSISHCVTSLFCILRNLQGDLIFLIKSCHHYKYLGDESILLWNAEKGVINCYFIWCICHRIQWHVLSIYYHLQLFYPVQNCCCCAVSVYYIKDHNLGYIMLQFCADWDNYEF